MSASVLVDPIPGIDDPKVVTKSIGMKVIDPTYTEVIELTSCTPTSSGGDLNDDAAAVDSR